LAAVRASVILEAVVFRKVRGIMTNRFFPTVIRDRNTYPTSDFRPMAETDFHRKLMILVIDTLMAWAANRPDVYVTGNLLLFSEKGNKRKHVAPDCFVVFGVPNYDRLNYLLWDEGRSPNVVIEITSESTRKEDIETKFALYRDTLKVPEYFLFDPKGEYLNPSLQGYRLTEGTYTPIEATGGRLVSHELGLHLERDGQLLRFWNPQTGEWIPTPPERLHTEQSLRMRAEEQRDAERAAKEAERIEKERERAAKEAERAEKERERAAKEAERAEKERERAARIAAEAEAERLRSEVVELRRKLGNP
jgi:Uma2 family endonuclease